MGRQMILASEDCQIREWRRAGPLLLWILTSSRLNGDTCPTSVNKAVLFNISKSHLPLPTATHLDTVFSHNLVMKHLPGADPELVLLGHRSEELEVRLWEAGGGAGR